MADKSKIQWCDATINPCAGCSPVSPACDNCYAARMAHRLAANIKIPPYFVGLTDVAGKWTGQINLYPYLMKQALRWQKPRRIFVGSMTDLFHENVPDEFLDKVFAYMAMASQHTFMLLTKRPERMRAYAKTLGKHMESDGPSLAAGDMGLAGGWYYELGTRGWHLPNVWLGVTAENQAMAEERIPILLDTPAAKRFVSVEPMMGPVDLTCIDYPEACDTEVGLLDSLRGMTCDDDPTHPALDWVICGGESGPRARPMHPTWVRSLRDQCATAGVPFLFKQWGEWAPTREDPYDKAEPRRIGEHGRNTANLDNCTPDMGNEVYVYRVGKRAAGRLLDGVEHNAFPEVLT